MIFPPRKMAPGERLTAANYNTLLDYVKRITPLAGANVKVDYRLCGAVISGTPGGDAADRSIKPFTVRHHAGQWEIYMPDGCVNVGGTCEPINRAASAAGGDHEDDPKGWHALGLDETFGATGTDAEGNTYREWDVSVHAKTSAKMWQVDDLDAPARRLVWAGVTDRLKPSSSMTDAERYKDRPGDTFSATVARVRVTTVSNDGETDSNDGETDSNDGETDIIRSVTQLRETPIDVGDVPAPTGFDLVWYFSVVNGALNVEKVFCLRQVTTAAGMSITGDQMTDVTGAEDIYAKIDTENMAYGSGLVTVVTDPDDEEPHTTTHFVTWLLLYHLVENTVAGDYRENSLSNLQIYRA